MSDIAPPVAALVEEFSKLPGVGVKTAQRLTFHILRGTSDDARHLAEAILRVKEADPCLIFSNSRLDQDIICVV